METEGREAQRRAGQSCWARKELVGERLWVPFSFWSPSSPLRILQDCSIALWCRRGIPVRIMHSQCQDFRGHSVPQMKNYYFFSEDAWHTMAELNVDSIQHWSHFLLLVCSEFLLFFFPLQMNLSIFGWIRDIHQATGKTAWTQKECVDFSSSYWMDWIWGRNIRCSWLTQGSSTFPNPI